MVNTGYYEKFGHLPKRRRKKRVGSENDPNEKGANKRNNYGL